MTEKIVFSGGNTTITTAEGSFFEQVENQITGNTTQNPSQGEPQAQEQTKIAVPSPSPQNTETRPEWLPANFKTVDDFVKSNQEAQRKITEQAQMIQQLKTGQTSQAPTPSPAPSTSSETQQTPEVKEAAKELTHEQQQDLTNKLNTGFFENYSQEYVNTGTLSPESRQAIIDAGVPTNLLDAHIAGVQALATQRDSQVYSVLGGEDKAGTILQWASTNLDLDTINRFNDAMSSTNIEAAKDQARALLTRYVDANGNEPTILQGGEGLTGDKPYESHSEMMTDMKNPLYKARGPEGDAFRAMVDRKLMGSDKVMTQVRDATRSGRY